MFAVTFIQPNGTSERVSADDGETAMQVATRQGIDGILAECGGNAMCATCHVYVDEAWLARLPAIADDEDELLDGTAAERLPESRLSCQITITHALDGLVLRLPQRQI